MKPIVSALFLFAYGVSQAGTGDYSAVSSSVSENGRTVGRLQISFPDFETSAEGSALMGDDWTTTKRHVSTFVTGSHKLCRIAVEVKEASGCNAWQFKRSEGGWFTLSVFASGAVLSSQANAVATCGDYPFKRGRIRVAVREVVMITPDASPEYLAQQGCQESFGQGSQGVFNR